LLASDVFFLYIYIFVFLLFYYFTYYCIVFFFLFVLVGLPQVSIIVASISVDCQHTTLGLQTQSSVGGPYWQPPAAQARLALVLRRRWCWTGSGRRLCSAAPRQPEPRGWAEWK